MRVFLLLLCALSFNITQAQPGGGGGGGGMRGGQGGGMGQGGSMQERQERPEFNASQMAGIFSYDDKEVVKKIKIKKKDKDLILNVRQAINKYNTNVQEIALLNKDNFDTLNVFVNTIMKSAMQNRRQQQSGYGMQSGGGMQDDNDMQNDDSRNVMRNTMRLSKEKIEPAKIAVQEEEMKLNKNLESILDEKQYKKWLKYQEDTKEAMQPEKPSNNRQSQNQGGGGMRGSGGGGGGGGMR
ncbi:hypothetical protein [Algibacter sp. R77976]|uniref:hypothetical protein n=1 Tax=Algibacter sp. R77976 TaxID=3093873 RepID=UPI0037CCAA6E